MRKAVWCHLTTMMVVVALVASANGSDGDSMACLQRAHAKSVSIQRQFQRDLQRLIEKDRPDLKDVAAVGVATQMAYFDMMEARFAYLLRTQPGRIETVVEPNGAAVVFDWSDKDTTALLKADPTYEQLEVKWLSLKTTAERHRDRSKLLDYIQSSQEFRALSRRFVETHHAVKDILERCRSH